ncbi:uncharacterized protein LOC110848772 isoform X2 [Folsomia candida]|uniref:uncharacterized protein LOC110848772 isoform X2 n=1 Tax=Folsomia candida TaxID=158441 RepID=UPI0016051F90|nr:uncharacterized protein LOC110848772 isoform X2 [Folsomia candida]
MDILNVRFFGWQPERRRVEWQKRFYEKKIVDVAMGVFSSSDNDHGRCDPDHLLASLSHDFYKETILELVAEQERKDGQIQDMKSSFEEEIKRLQTRQEADLADTVEAHFLQVQQLTQGQEELIRDLLSGCEQGLFKEMREEYLIASERNVELKTTNGNKIWVQFSKFSSQKKGIIIAVISIVTVATAGWASWGFITWVWPRLIIFADSVLANPQTLSVWMTYLVELLNSPQFQTFVLAWEQGQPVMNCLKPFLNTALLASALQLAPNFLSQLKKRKSGNTATF